MLTISEISQRLAHQADALCRELLPNGKVNGCEWECGSVSGEEGKSLKVCISGSKQGVWSDFASDEGGDLVDLIAAAKGFNVAEAVSFAKEWLGIKDDKPDFNQKKKKYSKPCFPDAVKVQDASVVTEYFAGRGISKMTMSRYRIAENGTDVTFPSFVGDELIFWKTRNINDKKRMFVSKDSMPCLFGWQSIDPLCRWVVITEGEIDAMSYAEQGIPALSVPFGGGGGNKQRWLDYEYDRLLNFDCIYLSMDNDKAGQEALQELLPRIGQHRVMIPDLMGYKDANEALKNGVNLMDSLRNSTSIDPEELKSASEFHDEVMAYFENEFETEGSLLPWKKTHNIIRVRGGEVSIWVGINGHGKTELMGQVCVNNAYMGYRTCVASLEMKPKKLLASQYRQATCENKPTRRQGEAVRDMYMDNIWIFNLRGTAKAKRILEVFEYAYRRYGVKQFVIDNLSKCGFNDDDYNGQKKFVDLITDFAVENDVHVHLIVHSRKQDNEDKPPNKMDVKGSGAITDMVDNVFSVWRNKPKEEKVRKSNTGADYDNEPDALLSCWKQRHGDWEGQIHLWFEHASKQFTEDANRYGYKYV